MRTFLSIVAVSVAGVVLVCFIVSSKIDSNFNRIVSSGRAARSGSPTPSGADSQARAKIQSQIKSAKRLHSSLTVVDLHADSLLWNRDLLKRNERGHVDVPRLIEGNVAVQVFTIVTKVPEDMNIGSNSGDSDKITSLSIVQGWPPSTWRSLSQRTLFQADKLRDFARRSDGKLTVVESVSDLDNYLSRREREHDITAGILGIEGAHALEGDLKNIDVFYDRGIRLIAPVHFFDNNIGGSAHGKKRGGLTPLGIKMIEKMQKKGMIVDLAHASPAVFRDAIRISTRPIVVSHTGVKGTCNNNRNLSDDQLRGVARTGGVIGIGYWKTAVGGRDVGAIVRAIKYATRVAGVDHVSLGSDFDGAVTTPFDASQLSLVTEALQKAGFTDEEIAKIMGGNALRVFKEVLPEK